MNGNDRRKNEQDTYCLITEGLESVSEKDLKESTAMNQTSSAEKERQMVTIEGRTIRY